MELLEFHLNLLVSLVGEINYLSAYNTKKKKALDFVVVFFFYARSRSIYFLASVSRILNEN